MHIQSSFCAGLSQDGSIFQAERDHVQSMVDGSLIFSFGTKRPAHARSHEKDICPELTAPHARSRPLTPVSCHVSLPLCVFLKDVSGEMLIFRPVQKNAVLGNIMIFSLTEVYFLGFSWCIKDHANTVTNTSDGVGELDDPFESTASGDRLGIVSWGDTKDNNSTCIVCANKLRKGMFRYFWRGKRRTVERTIHEQCVLEHKFLLPTAGQWL